MKKLTYFWAVVALASFIFSSAWGGSGSRILAEAASTRETVVGSGSPDMVPSFVHSFAHWPALSSAPSSIFFSQSSRDTSFAPEASGLDDLFASRKKAYVAGVKPTSATQDAQHALIGKHHDYWKTGVETPYGGDGVKLDGTDAAVSESACFGMVVSAAMADYKKKELAMIAATGQRNMHAPGFAGTSPVSQATGNHGNEPQRPSLIAASGNGWNA